MRLLFVTQVLDRGDAVLGFVPRWVEGLAKVAERVRVLALEVGNTGGLPSNVDWREIGRRGRIRRFLRYRSFLREALGRDGFDQVLAHMVPRYASAAAGPARRAGAGLHLWYTHGTVDGRLRRAERQVDRLFTASAESLRLESHKRVVTGHGIDLARFAGLGAPPAGAPRLLVVGRITPKKDPLAAVEALARLPGVELDLAGPELAPGDEAYAAELAARIARPDVAGRVRRLGTVPYPAMGELYRGATLVLNPSRTGSLDKVVLEAMAAERPVLSCNDGFAQLVAPLGAQGAGLAFEPGDAEGLARRIAALLEAGPAARAELGRCLREEVAAHHEVDALMARLVREMESAR